MATPLSTYLENKLPKRPSGLLIVFIIVFLGLSLLFLSNAFDYISKGEKSTEIMGWFGGFLGMVFLAFLFLIPNIRYSGKRKSLIPQNEYDYNLSNSIYNSFVTLHNSSPNIVDDKMKGVLVYRSYSLGEIVRHFDNQTNAQITGWLDHKFGVVGWGVGVQMGSVGLGTGQTGIIGKSSVHLDLTGTTRDNLVGDGFVAVIEQNPLSGKGDIVRVAVPSEPASREYITTLILSLGRGFGEGSYREEVFRKNIGFLQSSIRSDITYVSDRLSSISRMEPSRKPTITVVGSGLSEHCVLAGAIQFENDNRWYQLFPLSLIQKIIEIAGSNLPIEKPKTYSLNQV
jgi:hypothetical protein